MRPGRWARRVALASVTAVITVAAVVVPLAHGPAGAALSPAGTAPYPENVCTPPSPYPPGMSKGEDNGDAAGVWWTYDPSTPDNCLYPSHGVGESRRSVNVGDEITFSEPPTHGSSTYYWDTATTQSAYYPGPSPNGFNYTFLQLDRFINPTATKQSVTNPTCGPICYGNLTFNTSSLEVVAGCQATTNYCTVKVLPSATQDFGSSYQPQIWWVFADPFGQPGYGEVAFQFVPVTLSVHISFPGSTGSPPTVSLGTTFSAEVDVSASPGTGVTGVRFVGSPIAFDPGAGVTVVGGPAPPLSQPFDLAGGAQRVFTYQVKALDSGNLTASSQVTGSVGSQEVTAQDREPLTINKALSVDITFPGASSTKAASANVGSTFLADVTVSASPGTNVDAVHFTSAPLGFAPAADVRVLSGPSPPLNQPFALAGGTQRTFAYQLKALQGGQVTVSSQAAGLVGNHEVTAEDNEPFTINVPSTLVVTLKVSPSKVKVNQTPEGVDPVTVTVEADVTNKGKRRADNVTLYRELSIGVLDHYHVPAIPIKQGARPSPSESLGTITPGATKIARYKLEVSGDGTYSLETVATGYQAGQVVHGVGKTQLAPQSQLLVWSAAIGREVRDPQTPELIPGGSVFTIRITLEDRSYTSPIVLAPMGPKNMKGNASDGHVQTAGFPIEQIDESAPAPSQMELLAPRQTKTLEMVVRTVKSDARFIPELLTKGQSPPPGGGTRAMVTLPDYWRGWVVSDKDPHQVDRQLTADDEVTAPGSTEFDVSVNDAPLDAAELSAADKRYLAAGEVALAVPYAAQQLITGFWSLASETVPRALSAAYLGVLEVVTYESKLWQGMLADPSQEGAFFSQLDQVIGSVYDQVTDFPAFAAEAKALIANANKTVFSHYAGIEQDLYAGDYDTAVKALSEEAVVGLASIPGAPEAGLAAAGSALSAGERLVNVTSLAAARLVRWDGAVELLEVGNSDASAKLASWLAHALGQAANPIEEALDIKNFPVRLLGVPLDISKMASLSGYSEEQIANLLRFCTDNDVIVTVRPRPSAALGWLDSPFGAALKPELFKMKTVDAIDEAYLGYAPGPGQATVASLVVRVPPSEADVIAALRANHVTDGSAEWDAVIARYQSRLREFTKAATGKNGDVQDMVQWNKAGRVTTKWNWLDNDIQLANEPQSVGFRLVNMTTGERLPPGLQPQPGTNYAVEVLKLNKDGSPVTGAVWQRVTGDADMVSIVNPDGSGLTEAQHVKLLDFLRDSDLGVAHPDLATWTRSDEANPFFFDAKKKQLESGTFLQACPDGTIRAVRYAPALTNLFQQGVDAYNYYIKFVGGCESPLAAVSAAGVAVP